MRPAPQVQLRPTRMATARILVVEDEPAILAYMRAALEVDRHAVRAAGTLAEARAALALETPDVVLLDLGLPDGDGLDLVAELDARGGVGPAVLVVSGDGSALEWALELGARDFVRKPFRAIELRARVRAAVRDRRALARLEMTRARARHSADRSRRVRLAAVALSAAVDIEAVARTILTAGTATLGALAGSVAQLSDDGTRLRLLATTGYPDGSRIGDTSIDDRLPGPEAARLCRAIFIGDPKRILERYPLLEARPEGIGPAAVAAAPLIVDNRAIGAVSFRFPAGPVPRSTRTFVQALAAVGGQALDRARLYAAARWRETRFRTLIEHAHDITTVLGADGTILYDSPSVERVLGYRQLELLGRDAFALIHEDDRPAVLARFGELLAAHDARASALFRFRHEDGSWRWLESVGTNALHVPEVGGVVVNSRDVTDRHASEHRLRFQARLLDSVAEAAIATDVEGHVLYWNQCAERLYGWTADEVIGRPILDFIAAPDQRARAEDSIAHLREGTGYSGEYPVRRRDGTTFMAYVISSPVYDEQGRVVGHVGLSVDLTERKRAEEDRARLAQTLALLEERDRIAMELHDGAIQALYGTTLQLGAAVRMLPEDAPIRPALATAVGELNNVIRDVRGYIHGLAGPRNPEGLRAGLQALVDRYRGGSVAIELVMPGREARIEAALGRERVAHVLQIAGEAVANALRHAAASTVTISATWTRRTFVLEVRDDGRGLPTDTPPTASGNGLRNMTARAGIVGGQLDIVSPPGRGTTVRLEVPLAPGAG